MLELPLVEGVEGIEIPLSFLVNSLKQLNIGGGRKNYQAIAANKALWLLCFCPHLHQAVLNFSIATSEAKSLEEHHEAFARISNVSDLAIAFSFVEDKLDRSTWWGLEWESGRSWNGGSRNSEVISPFLG